jgi:hypothetical protein
MKQEKIQYSAIVLDDRSRFKLFKKLQNVIPEDWEKIGDHMTINIGEIDEKFERYLGLPVKLNVDKIGIDDNVIAIAVNVSGLPPIDGKPHITVAINKKNGARPSMSKNIQKWENLKRPLYLVGKVQEIPYNL